MAPSFISVASAADFPLTISSPSIVILSADKRMCLLFIVICDVAEIKISPRLSIITSSVSAFVQLRISLVFQFSATEIVWVNPAMATAAISFQAYFCQMVSNLDLVFVETAMLFAAKEVQHYSFEPAKQPRGVVVEIVFLHLFACFQIRFRIRRSISVSHSLGGPHFFASKFQSNSYTSRPYGSTFQ